MGSMVVFFLLGYAFLWGLRKGSTFCVALCMPALMPTITYLSSWKEGLKAGVKFNIPRIFLLSAFGGLLGFILFKAKNTDILSDFSRFSFTTGYIIIGIFLAVLGLYSLINSIEEHEDIKDNVCHPLFRFLKRDDYPFMTGLIFSIVCVGESAIALETFVLTGSVALFNDSLFSAIILGIGIMFIFSIGLALPTVLFSIAGSHLSEKSGKKILNKVRVVSSILMITFGLIVIIQSI